jgi:hypothetical protein
MPLLPRRRAAVRRAEARPRWGLSIIVLAALSNLGLVCNRKDHAPSADAAATLPTAPAVTEPSMPANTTPESTSTPPATTPKGPSPTACKTDADCRLFSDACGICSCRPFAKTAPNPTCPGPLTPCLIDPCTGLHAICRKGNCAIGDPAEGTPPPDAAAGAKDASSGNAAAKGADAAVKSSDAAPATGASATPPKASDAAARN